MDDADLLEVLDEAASAVRRSLDRLDDWSEAGTRQGQYQSDIAADKAVTEVLEQAGLGWMSEETGAEHLDRALVVVVDPLDGSTNADRGIPWFATSLCAVDETGPRASLVVDQSRDRRYRATRGGGATVDGGDLTPSSQTKLGDAIIGMSGYPPRYLGWKQFRALGAVALDLCAVAEGVLDGYLDASPSAHGSWDYLGAMLICQEAGAEVAEAFGRPLVELDHGARRTPVGAGTPELLSQIVDARRSIAWPADPDLD